MRLWGQVMAWSTAAKRREPDASKLSKLRISQLQTVDTSNYVPVEDEPASASEFALAQGI